MPAPLCQVVGVEVRQATLDDAAEIVCLAAVMYASMGQDSETPGWRLEAETHVVRRPGIDLSAAVVDHPSCAGRLVASAAITVATRLPGPRNPTARVGYVQWVAADPEWRRRGLATLVVQSLLERMDREGVAVVELHATADGAGVYRHLGFADSGPPALRRFGPSPVSRPARPARRPARPAG